MAMTWAVRSKKDNPGWIRHRTTKVQLNMLLCENAIIVWARHRLQGKEDDYKTPEHKLKLCHSIKLQCYCERQIFSRAWTAISRQSTRQRNFMIWRKTYLRPNMSACLFDLLHTFLGFFLPICLNSLPSQRRRFVWNLFLLFMSTAFSGNLFHMWVTL